MQIKAQGLKVSAMNVGSPTAPDPITRQHPDNPAVYKTDVRNFAWILHENAGRPLENYPGAVPATKTYGTPFDVLAARVKKDAQFGRGMVVEMAKARLPLADPDRYKQEEYVWALAKLAGGPVVLNAGYDFCGVPAGTDDCNRTGLNAALTDIRLGTPLDVGAVRRPRATGRAACGCDGSRTDSWSSPRTAPRSAPRPSRSAPAPAGV